MTIDKGNLINRVSATTPSGTYSTNTTINKISGFIEFRKTVTIKQGATVTLNIINGNFPNGVPVPLTECENEPGTKSKFTFEYTIQENDSIQSDGDLDVTAFSFTKVILDGKEIPISISDVPTTGKFSTNRQIKLLTGNPTVRPETVTLTGEDSNAVLTVTFNRVITKGNGTITFTQSDTDYRVPTVLSATEYNDLKATLGAEIDTYYEAAVNGATKNENYLTPDTKTKYVLKFSYDNNSPELKNLFKENKLHIVEIPIYASAVSVNEDTLTVKLTDSYALPVKGATYTLEISEGAVQDSVRNTNKAYHHLTEITSAGIENTEIRIEKKGYEIVNAGNLLKSDVNMPETAQMKIACQTPGSSIKYGINQSSSTHVVINDCSYHDTKTADVTIPTINENYTGTITLGNPGLTFDTAKGMKFAIAAQASTDTAKSEVAYEYAARTVLKFYIGNRYKNADANDGGNDQDDHGNFYSTKIGAKVSKLTIWIIGGDSDSGGNTIDPFPLSWGDPSNFKMMKLNGSKDKTTVKGEWYWITWDISAPTYHGFVAGDVPSDAQENGPSIWYAGECFYTPLKSYYILYPGETLYMTMHDADGGYNDPNNNNQWVGAAFHPDTRELIKYDEAGRASYFFRWKNIGTR